MARDALTEIEWARVRAWMADKRRSDYQSLPERFRRQLAAVAKGEREYSLRHHVVSYQIAREALKYAKDE